MTHTMTAFEFWCSSRLNVVVHAYDACDAEIVVSKAITAKEAKHLGW